MSGPTCVPNSVLKTDMHICFFLKSQRVASITTEQKMYFIVFLCVKHIQSFLSFAFSHVNTQGCLLFSSKAAIQVHLLANT